MDVADVHRHARAASGLVDWARDFCGSLDGEAQLSNLARAALPPRVGNSLTNRLRVVDRVRRHPEIAGEPLHRLMKGNTR